MTAASERRACIKCGRAIDAQETVCEVCNRARMATPSATQYHGTIAAAIVLGVAALAIAGSLSMRGIGPFTSSTLSVEPSPLGGVEVTVAVVNEGTRAGRATCRIVAADAAGRRIGTASTVTDSLDAGERLVFAQRLAGVQDPPERISVTCE